MRQAAAVLGVSVKVLKEAKAKGCPAFVGSRVHLNLFEEWRADHPAEELVSFGDKGEEQTRLYRLRAERIQFELDRDRGNFWPKAEVASAWQSAATRARQIWMQIPKLAPQLIGRAVEEIERLLRTEVDRSLEELRKNPLG